MLLQHGSSKHALCVLVENIRANMKSVSCGFCSLQSLWLALSITFGLRRSFKKSTSESAFLALHKVAV